MHRFIRGTVARRASTAGTTTSVATRHIRDGRTTNNINNIAFVMSNQAKCTSSSSRKYSTTCHLRNENKSAASDNENENTTEESKETGEAADEDADGTPTEITDSEKIQKLESQLKDMKDQLLRSMANEENVRRIAKKDIENAKNFGITSFAKSMLDVADNFNRAIDAIPNEKKEELTNGNGDPIFASLLEGIIAVEKGLQKSFNSQGLVRFGDIGDKFDPDMYEALYQQPDADKDEDTVCAILKSGYKLKDRVVRAAQVGTTKKP